MRAVAGVAGRETSRASALRWCLMGGIILLGTALRLHALGSKSLWLDEISVLQVAQRDFPSVLEGAKGHVSAPPLDYLIVHVAAGFGQKEFLLRFPAAMWGILSLALTFKVGEQILGRRIGLVGAFLLAINPFHIYFSQEMKFYSILVLFSLLSILFYVRALRMRTWGAWLGYAVVMVAGVYAHSYVALVGVAEAIHLVGKWLIDRLRARFRGTAAPGMLPGRSVIAFCLVGASVLGCYAPWIVWDFLQEAGPGRAFHTTLSPAFIAQVFQGMVLSQDPAVAWLWMPGRIPYPIAVPVSLILGVILALAAVGGSVYLLIKGRPNLLVLLVLLAPFLTLVLDNAARYWFAQRQVIFALPAYLLLAGYGLLLAGQVLGRIAARPGRAWLRHVPLAVLLGAVVLLSVRPIQAHYKQEVQNWRDVALLLRHQARPGDQVVSWKWASSSLTFYEPGLEALGMQNLFDEHKEALEELVQQASGRIWYVRDQVWFQDREPLEEWARSNAQVTVDLGGVELSLWHRGDVSPAQMLAEKQALLEEAVEQYPTYAAMAELGDTYLQQNRLDEAITQFRQAIDLVPKWGMAYTKLGNSYRAMGRLEDATRSYKMSMRIDPGYVGAYLQLGSICDEEGQTGQALGLYQQATQVAPMSDWAWQSLGNAYRKLGKLTEAEVAYGTALRLNPNQAAAQMGLGRSLMDQGRSAEALDHFEEAARLQPQNVNWLLELANLYRDLGYRDKALAAFRQVLAQDQGNPQATEALRRLEP